MGNTQSTHQQSNDDTNNDTTTTGNLNESSPLLNNNQEEQEHTEQEHTEQEEAIPNQQTHTTDDLEAQENHHNNEANELTPLLSKTEIPHYSILRSIFKPNWVHVLILFLILLVSTIYLTLNNIENSINDSINIEIYNTTFENLTRQGVNINVQGSITIDYNKIENNFVQKSILKLGSFLIGGITITSIKPVQIHVRLIDVDSPFLYLLDTIPPPIEVDIRQAHTTSLNFSSDCSLGETQFFEFLKYYYKLDGDEINMDVKIHSNQSQIQALKFVKFNIYDIEISDFVSVNKKDFKLLPSVLEIKKVDITSDHPNVIDLSVNLQVSNDYGLTLDLSTIEWDLLFKDCNEELVKVGKWKTLPTKLSPHELTNVHVIGQITDVPSCLMEDCINHVSPINQLVQNYLNESPIHFAIHLSDYQTTTNLDWILNSLKSLPPIELSIKLPKIKIPLNSVESNSTDIIMNNETKDNKTLSKILSTVINNNSTFQFSIPSPFVVDLYKFKLNFNVGWKNNLLLSAKSKEFVYSSVNQLEESLNVDVNSSDLDVDLINPSYIGKAVNKFINDNDYEFLINEDIYLNVSLTDIDLSLPLVNRTTIKHLDISQIKLPSKFANLANDLNLVNDLFLSQLNITINEVYLFESTPNSIEFLVELSIYNPLNLSLEIPKYNQQEISIGLNVNQTKVGSLNFKELFLPKDERTDIIANVKLEYSKPSEKQILQDFISNFISSNSSTTTSQLVNIGSNSVTNNIGLDLFLREITIPNLTIPNITFNIPEYKPAQNEVSTKDLKIFILDVTIHIITSEIEVKIYNPLINTELKLNILSSIAKYDDIILGYLAKTEYLIIPPGFYTSPRIPIKIYYGASMDLLKKNLNKELQIDLISELNLMIDLFELRLLYKGKNLVSKVRL
ncbi:hypothetical protein KGF54_005476 [Candida jiufengensis]|uniref:uncharacterized protein n=1 Tax=Candida jiufengensis TaxID=497108 RepID=UPI0022241C43|nr:uncharacterized protein KGF54_005476 [Candida jiufengensis]KAI5949599.1 hypothetical protein KGF54_005476 [Candida jiufengensis]